MAGECCFASGHLHRVSASPRPHTTWPPYANQTPYRSPSSLTGERRTSQPALSRCLLYRLF
ncbi:hypothetical protein FII00_06960 [Salmonella enterica subsp. enterica]|nr:hypothetical protein [Salmonella enterica subsp. enterica serovar Newport]